MTSSWFFILQLYLLNKSETLLPCYPGGVPALNLYDQFWYWQFLYYWHSGFSYIQHINQQMHSINTINKNHIIKLMASIVCCMFRHLRVIFRGSIKTRKHSPTHQSTLACWTVFLCFNRLPQDGTPVPKHVAAGTTNWKCRICVLLSASACRYVEWYWQYALWTQQRTVGYFFNVAFYVHCLSCSSFFPLRV